MALFRRANRLGTQTGFVLGRRLQRAGGFGAVGGEMLEETSPAQQPRATGARAPGDLLESSSAERDWECWGTTG